jgi:fibronectin type 3 domain-containing protein
MERLVAPNPPTGLAVTMVDGRTVYLQWVDNSESEERYRIERATAEDFKQNVRQFSGGVNDFRFTDTTAELGKTYFYRVFAGNQKGDSTPSNTVSVTLLKAPKDLAVEVPGPNQVNLVWADTVENEEGFRIERSVDPNFINKVVSYTVAAGVTRFGDIGVEPATTYYYRVRAYGAGYESVSSNVASATPLAEIEKRIAPAVPLERVVDMRGMFSDDFVCTRLDGVRQLSVVAGTLIRDRSGYLVLELTSVPLDFPVLAPTRTSLLNLPRHYHPFGLSYLPPVTVVTEQECRLAGRMVNLGPESTRFSQPVALSLEYDPAMVPPGFDEEELRIAWYNPDIDAWIELPSVCSPGQRTVTAWASHFSVFAVVAPGDPVVPWQQIAVVFIIEVFAGILAILIVTTRRRTFPADLPQATSRFPALPERAGGEPIT